MKDLDALVSTNPLQLGNKPNVEVVGETEDQSAGNVRFNDNRSMWSERRSVLTSFTGKLTTGNTVCLCVCHVCLFVTSVLFHHLKKLTYTNFNLGAVFDGHH